MSNGATLTDFSQPEAWKAEIERSRRTAEPYWEKWQENLDYYTGKSKEATTAIAADADYINVNADFTNAEVKLSQLFFDTPELQLTATGGFRSPLPAAPVPGAPPQQQLDPASIIAAHRMLLNELLGPDHADVLPTVQKAIKDCLVTAGVGATKICYEAAMETVPTPPELQLAGIEQPTLDRPVDEQWVWRRIPSKKFRIPADFRDTDFDQAPWVAMEFRMPIAEARRLFTLPPEVEATSERDEKVLDPTMRTDEVSSVPYVDGVEIWYKAHIFDEDVINPKVIRRHVIVDGVDGFVEKTTENPYQTLLPNGRLTADSMIGYPIHVLAIRSVPDSAFVPSDSSMTRPLIRELCKFRTQQVQERDANIPRVLYDIEKLPPDAVQRIQQGVVGSLIPVPADTLAGGVERVMAQVTQGNQTRGSYVANDYIQRDLDKTLGVDAIGSGIKDQQSTTATEVSIVDRQRNVRLDHERRAVLAWYLKGVAKFSALVCRYMTPELAVPYVGQQASQVWAQWDKKTWDGRFVFKSRPDSQLKLDAAAERKFWLDLYQFVARDPHANRLFVLRQLMERAGVDPAEATVPQIPQEKEPPSVAFAAKGEDLIAPQAPQVREILAQGGLQISQQAISETARQLLEQMLMGIRDANGQVVTATQTPQGHGGAVEKVRPLDQASADQSGQRRTGPPPKGAVP